MNTEAQIKNPFSYINLLIAVLSVLVLIIMFIDTVAVLDEETSRLFNFLDFGICLVFLVDFIYRFYKAPTKLEFLKWGWIDLLSSIPNLDIFRYGRIFRLIRIIRLFRAFPDLKAFINGLFKNKSYGTIVSVSLLTLIIVLSSSIFILQAENSSESNIKSAEDAIWWAFVTVTTVGYGDLYPVTSVGRLIAVAVMTCGVGLFGTFTALVASWFVDNK